MRVEPYASGRAPHKGEAADALQYPHAGRTLCINSISDEILQAQKLSVPSCGSNPMHPGLLLAHRPMTALLQYPHAGRTLCIDARTPGARSQPLPCSTLMRVEPYASRTS